MLVSKKFASLVLDLNTKYIPPEIKNIIFEYAIFKPKNKDELRKALLMFHKNKALKKYGIPDNWNVSNVTDMSFLFKGLLFNEDISSWDVSNVTNMNNMFTESHFKQ